MMTTTSFSSNSFTRMFTAILLGALVLTSIAVAKATPVADRDIAVELQAALGSVEAPSLADTLASLERKVKTFARRDHGGRKQRPVRMLAAATATETETLEMETIVVEVEKPNTNVEIDAILAEVEADHAEYLELTKLEDAAKGATTEELEIIAEIADIEFGITIDESTPSEMIVEIDLTTPETQRQARLDARIETATTAPRPELPAQAQAILASVDAFLAAAPAVGELTAARPAAPAAAATPAPVEKRVLIASLDAVPGAEPIEPSPFGIVLDLEPLNGFPVVTPLTISLDELSRRGLSATDLDPGVEISGAHPISDLVFIK